MHELGSQQTLPRNNFIVIYSVFLHICNNQTKPQTRPLSQHTSEIIQQHLQRNTKIGLKWPNMTPLKPQTTKLNPKPDPIPAQHTSEIIQQHLQRHPKMNLNEPAPPLALKFLEKKVPALLCRLLFDCIYSVFYTSHNTNGCMQHNSKNFKMCLPCRKNAL